ncbi:unnamed protein product, partial [Prorocentrum cordatum]
VPPCDAGAGERVSRDVLMPLRCLGGRWSTGSVAVDLEVRFVSPAQASELLSMPADLAKREPSPGIPREVAPTVTPSNADPPLGGEGGPRDAAQRCAPLPLPVLLRRRLAADDLEQSKARPLGTAARQGTDGSGGRAGRRRLVRLGQEAGLLQQHHNRQMSTCRERGQLDPGAGPCRSDRETLAALRALLGAGTARAAVGDGTGSSFCPGASAPTRFTCVGAPVPRAQAAAIAGVDTRLLGKPRDFSGEQPAWRDWSAVFKNYSGAAVPRLTSLMQSAAQSTAPVPNVALTAWRQRAEKCEPKMRTRIAGQPMRILSFSLQGDAPERLTARGREIAACERDSEKTLDDGAKIGTFLLRPSESPRKTRPLMKVDQLTRRADFRAEIASARAQPVPMDIGAVCFWDTREPHSETAAWHLRLRLRPHEDLPFTSAQELCEVASMEGRGICPLDTGACMEAEEGAPIKRLAAPARPTAAERQGHIAGGPSVFRARCRVCCAGRGRMHRRTSGGPEVGILVVGCDCGRLGDGGADAQRQPRALPLRSRCAGDRWLGAAAVQAMGACECATRELASDVVGSGFDEVLFGGDGEASIAALKTSVAAALKLEGARAKLGGSTGHGSHGDGLAMAAVREAKDAARANLARLAARRGQNFNLQHPIIPRLAKYLAAMINRERRGPGGRVDELYAGASRGARKAETARRCEATGRYDPAFPNTVAARPWGCRAIAEHERAPMHSEDCRARSEIELAKADAGRQRLTKAFWRPASAGQAQGAREEISGAGATAAASAATAAPAAASPASAGGLEEIAAASAAAAAAAAASPSGAGGAGAAAAALAAAALAAALPRQGRPARQRAALAGHEGSDMGACPPTMKGHIEIQVPGAEGDVGAAMVAARGLRAEAAAQAEARPRAQFRCKASAVGLHAGAAMDARPGWGLGLDGDRQGAQGRLDVEKPCLLVLGRAKTREKHQPRLVVEGLRALRSSKRAAGGGAAGGVLGDDCELTIFAAEAWPVPEKPERSSPVFDIGVDTGVFSTLIRSASLVGAVAVLTRERDELRLKHDQALVDMEELRTQADSVGAASAALQQERDSLRDSCSQLEAEKRRQQDLAAGLEQERDALVARAAEQAADVASDGLSLASNRLEDALGV